MKAHLLLLTALLIGAHLRAGDLPQSGYVAHEWGTFTDVQGADGAQMYWNPLIAPDLPKFVYDGRARKIRGRSLNVVVAGKTGTSSRQRMETPVIYFYSDRARTIDVSVHFPEGSITEWYPLRGAADVAPFSSAGSQPVLRWNGLMILPATKASTAALPKDDTVSHYYAARETDSALVRAVDGAKIETEKFLFYRGVAQFQAPLKVKVEGEKADRITLENAGAEPLEHLFVYQVGVSGVTWLKTARLRPGESRTVETAMGGQSLMELADALRASLVEQGLYEKEAAAMVKTWEDSWFGEHGTRVLYTLPRAWTDRALPLHLSPAPKELERVMVARAEIITPASERALEDQLQHYVAAAQPARATIVDETRALGFGRFLEPAFRRVMARRTWPNETYSLSYELMSAAMKPAISGAVVSAAR